MLGLKHVRISFSVYDDRRDDLSLPVPGDELFDLLPQIKAFLLHFGAFVTWRHPNLKVLVWGEPADDVNAVDSVNGECIMPSRSWRTSVIRNPTIFFWTARLFDNV
jgi:hypothetical protein